MIISRCASLGKLSKNVAKNLLVQSRNDNIRKQIQRHSHDVKYYYRSAPTDPPHHQKIFEALGAIVWWWVLWHLFTDYHEFIPPHFPDPTKWTDEELGIPPAEE